MQNYLIEKPYQFVPRIRAGWPQQLLVRSGLLEITLRRRDNVVAHEIRNLDRLRRTLSSGDSLLLISNHCRPSDPSVLQLLSRDLKQPFYFMASWHVFEQGWLQRWILRLVGGFSVHREGMDRQSLNSAVEILQSAERPLVMFPEGTTSRTNDTLMGFMEGPMFVARLAAVRRKKSNGGRVVCHPIAIKYIVDDPEFAASIESLLQRLEQLLGWQSQALIPPLYRIQRIDEALIALKEIEHGVAYDSSTPIHQRRIQLVHALLNPLEQEWLASPQPDADVSTRTKMLIQQIFPELAKGEVSKAERERRWGQLERIDIVQQLCRHPERYIQQLPSRERILETIENFEELLTGQVSRAVRLKAVIDVQAGIEIPAQKHRDPTADPCLIAIRQSMEESLQRLSRETTLDHELSHFESGRTKAE